LSSSVLALALVPLFFFSFLAIRSLNMLPLPTVCTL
jgi:hypothetical protein